MSDDRAQQTAAAERQLAALVSREPGGALVEVRFRRAGGAMRQRFYTVDRLRAVAHTAVHLGQDHDVYLGCAPRRRRAGGRSAIKHGWALWADCDTPQASGALTDFDPSPSLIVGSGFICSARQQRRFGWAVRCRRHVVSEADLVPHGGWR